jgi:surfactin synthase thioesterase subunit
MVFLFCNFFILSIDVLATGPTETVIDCMQFKRLTENDIPMLLQHQNVPIGWSHDTTRVYVMELDSTKLRPLGAIGELCIGGSQVTRGYYKDDVRTRDRYVDDPFNPGQRLYRSGDLGRLSEDGIFECLGRVDGQVKLRGQRIELGEIEVTLTTNPVIKHSKVLKMVMADSIERLVGFVVLQTHSVPFEENQAARPLPTSLSRALFSSMEERLPVYMIPSFLVEIESLPVTSNGKLDERRLRAILSGMDWAHQAAFGQTNTGDGVASVSPPESHIQSQLRELWAQVLHIKVDSIGIDDAFYRLGGDSMSTLRLLAACQKVGLLLTLPQINNKSTIRTISASLELTTASSSTLRQLSTSQSNLGLLLIHDYTGSDEVYERISSSFPGVSVFSISDPTLGSDPLEQSLASVASTYLSYMFLQSNIDHWILGGWSLGGLIAFEMALQMQRRGQTPMGLVLLDTSVPTLPRDVSTKLRGKDQKTEEDKDSILTIQRSKSAHLYDTWQSSELLECPTLLLQADRTISGVRTRREELALERQKERDAWKELLARELRVEQTTASHWTLLDIEYVPHTAGVMKTFIQSVLA